MGGFGASEIPLLIISLMINIWPLFAKAESEKIVNTLESAVVKKEKQLGQIFTPAYLVEDILDFAGYATPDQIIEKHIIDNACGNGAFLSAIVRRYCLAYFEKYGTTNKRELSRHLGKYIHGIEIDKDIYAECIANLNKVAAEFMLPKIKWHVINADTMLVDEFDGAMDFVVGNPPYVRVHNLNSNMSRVKSYEFCDTGMTDLYLVFYEIGLKMLTNKGRLCYIAASSWINSIAGRKMREYVYSTRCLSGIVDLAHFQPFNASTYTAIVLLQKGCDKNSFGYYIYDKPKHIKLLDILSYEESFFDGYLYLGDRCVLRELKAIKATPSNHGVKVKNGFATLKDDVFIADEFPFEEYTIPVIKASTGKWRYAFYPYDQNGKPLSKSAIFSHKAVANYLEANKSKLIKDDDGEDNEAWYLYGRTQALKDVWVNKYAINTVIRDIASIKLNRVPAGSGIYSGLYIITDIPEDRLRAAIMCNDFVAYVAAHKKYKSGGYYTFNSKDLQQYLDYKLRGR